MLLREFTIDDHTITLFSESDDYIAKVINQKGDKVFYHEYRDYDKIKSSFDEIIRNIENGSCKISTIIDILNKSTL